MHRLQFRAFAVNLSIVDPSPVGHQHQAPAYPTIVPTLSLALHWGQLIAFSFIAAPNTFRSTRQYDISRRISSFLPNGWKDLAAAPP